MGWLLNEGPKWIFMFAWLATNIGLFIGYFFVFYEGKQYYYLRILTGPNLAVARASAAALNFDCLLILLPVCRNCVTFLRGSLRRCCRRNITRQLDKNIAFHKVCAYMICFLTAVHVFAHTFNFEYFLDAHDTGNSTTGTLKSALSLLPTTPDNTWINPIRNPNTNLMVECCKTVAGLSGIVITLALILIVSSATETLRRSYFEVFWFTHHLFTIFFIGLVVHGVQGLVRSQTNLDVHDPAVCADRWEQWETDPDCPIPIFTPGYAKTWYWVLGPMILYIVERCIRFYRSQQKVVITKVVKHPSKVIELQMKKKGFRMESGEYIFLHCPSVSRLEWHPFTLTSCPQEDFFSVHIRVVGDWTRALSKSLGCEEETQTESWQLPTVAVDGPFGTASEDIYRYQTAIMVGAGIGVTPFAAVLKDVWFRYQDPTYQMKLSKVYFFWICPDTNAFEWFTDLLKQLENKMAEAGKANLVEYNIYLTRGWDANIADDLHTHDEDIYDRITGLRQKTLFGRPNWDQIFAKVANDHKGTSCGVFFCGPKVLSTQLHKMSNKYSSSDPNDANATRFFYNKENF